MAEKFTIDDFAEESFSSAPKQKFTIDDFAEESFLSAPQPAPQQKFTIDDFAEESFSPASPADTPPASDARDEFGYISEAEQDRESFFLPTDIFRGFRQGLQTTKDVTGASMAAAGIARDRAEEGSGDALIQEGMAMVQRAEEGRKKIGIKKSDTFSGAWEEGIDEVFFDFVPYQIGALIPMIAEAVATGFGVGKIAEKTGSKTAPALKKIATKTAGKLAAATNPVTGAAAAVSTAVDAAKGIRKASNYIKKVVTRGAFKGDVKKEIALINKKRAEKGYAPLNKADAKIEANKIITRKLSEPKTQALFRKRLGNVIGSQTVLQRYGQGEVYGRAIHEAIKNEPDPQLQLDLIKELPAAKLATLGAVHGLTDQLLFAALGKTIRNANPKTRNALLATAISTGKLSTQSGVTEVIQSAIERYGAELPLSDKEALTEYLDSFAAGFAGVLPYGVAGGISARNKQVEAQTKEKLEQEIKDEAALTEARSVQRRKRAASDTNTSREAAAVQNIQEEFSVGPIETFGKYIRRTLLKLPENSSANKTLENIDLTKPGGIQVAIDTLESTLLPQEDGGLTTINKEPVRLTIDQLKKQLDSEYVPPARAETIGETIVETGDITAYDAVVATEINNIKKRNDIFITEARLNKILPNATNEVIDTVTERLKKEGIFVGSKKDALEAKTIAEAETQTRFDENIEKERLEKERLNKESQDRLDKMASVEFDENSQSDLDLDNKPQLAKGIDTQQDTPQDIRQQLSEALSELKRAESVRKQDYQRLKNPRKKAELDRNVEVAKQKVLNLEAQIPAETPAQAETRRVASLEAIAKIRADLNLSEQEARVILDAGQVIENTGETIESVTESFANQYGKNITQGIKRGLINIVDSVEGLAALNIPNYLGITLPANAKAFVLNGKAYFIANRITKEEAPGLLLHEVGAHYGLKRMLGVKKYNELVASLKSKRNSDKEISAAFDYVTRAYPEFTENGEANINDPYFVDEVIARISESTPNNSLYRTIVANIKAFLAKLGMGWNVNNISARQIQDLVQHSLKTAIKEKENTQSLPQDINRLQAALRDPNENTAENKNEQDELEKRRSPEQKRNNANREAGTTQQESFFDQPGQPTIPQKIGGAVFSFDSPLNTAIRKAMKESGKAFEEIKRVMLDIAVSQAVHAATVAERFLEYGGIRWSKEKQMFETFDTEPDPTTGKQMPLPSLLKATFLARDLAKKNNITFETMREIITRAFVARRVEYLVKQNQIYLSEYQTAIYNANRKRSEANRIESKSLEAAESLEAQADAIEQEAKINYRKNYVLVDNEQENLVADLEYFEKYGQDLENIYDMVIASKNRALKFAVQNQLMSQEQFEELTGLVLTENLLKKDPEILGGMVDVFVPFYREGKQRDNTNQKGLEERGRYYKLRGSFEPVADVFDNMERFIQSTITRGIINRAALAKISYSMQYLNNDTTGITHVREVDRATENKESNAVEVSRVIEGKQKKVLYEFSSPYFASAVSGIESISIPGISMMASVSNLFRSNIILYPAFGLSQLSQDAVSAMTSSGTFIPAAIPLRVIKNFVGTMIGMNKTHEDARKLGLVSGWAHLQAADDIENNPNWLGAYNAFRRQLSKVPGLTRSSAIEVPISGKIKPLELSVSGFLHRIAMASDNSIRESVFEQVMFETRIKNYFKNKASGKPTTWKATVGDEAEAYSKVAEVINFKRAGSDPRVTAVRRTVAFSGAMLQALSVQGRVFTLQGVSPTSKGVAAAQLASGLGQVTMMTLLYYMLISDEEEYKNLSDLEKMHYYYVPGMGAEGRLRVRPDMTALLGKVIPEAYLDLQMGRSDVRAFRQAINKSADKILAGNFIPTILQPLEEAVSNRSRFTEREIIPEYMEGIDAKNQYNSSTSEFAKQLGVMTNVSPLWVDHFLKGYLGTTGNMIGLGMGTLLEDQNIVASPPAKTERDARAAFPGNAAFFRKENENARARELIYDVIEQLKQAKNFSSDLTKRAGYNPTEGYRELANRLGQTPENSKDFTKRKLLNFSTQINIFSKVLSNYNANIKRIKESKSMKPELKRQKIAVLDNQLKSLLSRSAILNLRQQIYGSGVDANSPLTKRIRKLVKDSESID